MVSWRDAQPWADHADDHGIDCPVCDRKVCDLPQSLGEAVDFVQQHLAVAHPPTLDGEVVSACGAALSARCINGAAGCPVHPTRHPAPHPTCHETTGAAELAAGTRSWTCGRDCPPDDRAFRFATDDESRWPAADFSRAATAGTPAPCPVSLSPGPIDPEPARTGPVLTACARCGQPLADDNCPDDCGCLP